MTLGQLAETGWRLVVVCGPCGRQVPFNAEAAIELTPRLEAMSRRDVERRLTCQSCKCRRARIMREEEK